MVRRLRWARRLAPVADLVHPIVLAFLAAAFFSRLSGDPVRAVYFAVVGILLAADRLARRNRRRPTATVLRGPGAMAGVAGLAFSPDSVLSRRAAINRWLVIALPAGLAYAVVVGSFRPYSNAATISITLLAVAAVVAAWRTSGGSTTEPERLDGMGMAAWGLLLLGFGVWELIALFMQPAMTTDSPAHPTLSYLANGLLHAWPGRSAVLFAWLALGWYLARL
jgi:hypothetical protein